jgi:hypothetical protein
VIGELNAESPDYQKLDTSFAGFSPDRLSSFMEPPTKPR